MVNTLIDDLRARGLYDNCNDVETVISVCSAGAAGILPYIGFDLTADGLHVGHLSALMCLKRAMDLGHRCIVLLGGGTTYIGDPSGKSETRKILSPSQIDNNKIGICRDIVQILRPDVSFDAGNFRLDDEVVFDDQKLLIVDNYFWLKSLNYIDFLRDIGSLFSVNKLIKMDSMHSRLVDDQSLSFIEFNYPLLQAYDFYYLNKKYGCNCQMGGSDQWGNMLRGVELLHKTSGEKGYCITIPLTLRADGKKMGKSEQGAVWLSPNKLSDVDYWQYFRNVDDSDVDKFLKIFSSLSVEQIKQSEGEDVNLKKELLATNATAVCRGEDAAIAAAQQVKLAFGGMLDAEFAVDVQSGTGLVELILQVGFAASKNEARRLIASSGVKINGVAVVDDKAVVDANYISSFPSGASSDGVAAGGDEKELLFMLQCGKKNRQVVRVVPA